MADLVAATRTDSKEAADAAAGALTASRWVLASAAATGLAVVLQAREGVGEQQGLVRCPPAAAGKLADAVEPGEHGLTLERCR